MTLHQVVESDPKAYGSAHLWSLELLEVGRPLSCNNVTTFLHYLCSGGTHMASIGTYSDDPSAAIEVVLRGPRADDGEFLSVSYRLTREEIHGDGALHEGLEGWEKRLLVERIKDLTPTDNNPWIAIQTFSGVLELPYAA
jgi:hypothetical protein